MRDLDYKALGLKAGLEIHQQLKTERKLFCRCPAEFRYGDHDTEVLRHMRPTLSELGEYDGTALMEFKTKKTVIYQIFRDVDCTYEMDDTPPFMINKQALDIAVEIAMLLNLNIVDEMHISRKQYLDGSIPTGFQRTAIVGVEGHIPYKNRTIGIIQLGLEEDACREVEDKGHTIVFRADRLGFPLIEIVTEPDMHTPQEVAEVCERLRRLMRVTGKVRRGIGAAREDVNVSIKGGTRIEIKGVHKIPFIADLVHNEALRQKTLLEIKDELGKRGITENTFEPLDKNVKPILKDTSNLYLKKALENDDDIRAVRLKGFGGLLEQETQTDVIFAQEFAGRVKVIACLDEYPNILYPTSPYADGITGEEWDAIFQRVDAKHTDEVMIVWGGTDDVRTACKEIAIRAVDATNGVPSETRQAMPDGTTDFERILPGPDRMYPDTDLPPTPITDDHLETIRERLPEYPWEREKRYEKMGLPEDVIYTLPISPQVDIFEKIVEQLDVDPLRVAIPLVQLTKHLRREGYDISKLTDDMVYDIYEKFQNKTFAKEAFLDIFEKIVSNGNETAEDVLNELNLLPPLTQPELEKIVETTVEKNKDVAIDETEKRAHFLMGELRDIRGRIDGKIIWQTVMDKL